MEFQTKFKSLVSPSVEEQIEFQRRKQLEIDQRRKIRIDQSLAAYLQTETVEGALGGNIFSDQQLPPENSGLGESGPAKELEKDPIKLAAAKLKATRLTKLRIKRARNIALDVFFKKGLQKQDGSLEDAEQQIKPPQTKGKGKSQAPRQPTTLSNKEIRSIFENDSGYRKGRDPLLSAAVSTAKNKRKAFAEMIASIPTTEKAQGRTDIAILDEATRTFNPSARSDGQGRWKIRGLKTPLMVNQVRVHFRITRVMLRTDTQNRPWLLRGW